jgi:hypothetical protein
MTIKLKQFVKEGIQEDYLAELNYDLEKISSLQPFLKSGLVNPQINTAIRELRIEIKQQRWQLGLDKSQTKYKTKY